ncbi:Six-hairpin glycosidase-like protein [Blastocladiella britannica]|nr:Six-hairpin glycosidase-like protein [Blastocladiella britannica]
MTRISLLLALALCTVLTAAQSLGPDFDQFVAKESDVSYTKVLANISPAGTASGCVIASPSKSNPNYFYSWVRDSALTMDALLQVYESTSDSAKAKQIEDIMWAYVSFTQKQQGSTSNRSSSANDPTGLGEPKYEVDGSPFIGDWGRPQNDGPALRSSSLMRFAQAYVNKGGSIAKINQIFYQPAMPANTVVKKDLEVVSHVTGDGSFDLWEEVKGKHLYTLLVQRRSLVTGAKFAAQFSDPGAAGWYAKQAAALEPRLQSFWNGNYLTTTQDRVEGLDYKSSNLDVAQILAVLHAHGDATDGFFASDNDQVLATLLALKRSHRDAFPINKSYRGDLPPALGRYSEDKYYSGNPWFLATLAAGELQYRIVARAAAAGSITVTNTSLDYYRDLLASVGSSATASTGTFQRGSAQFQALTQGLVRYGDLWLSRVRVHMGGDGSMSEQLDKYSGFMLSAVDLTWNYAAFITAAAARDAARNALPAAF